jgi:nuclear pore complex protein Nup133
MIRQTVNVSDAEINERFRATALFAVLQVASRERDDEASFVVLQPENALLPPTLEEVESRWPGLTPDQVESLQAGYAEESDRLQALALEDVYDRVREIAQENPQWD